MIERVYNSYQPNDREIPPKGVQFRYKDRTAYVDPWDDWHYKRSGDCVNSYDIIQCDFRVPAPEEDDELWEDVPLGGISSAGDRKSFKGGAFCDVREFEVGRRVLNDCLRVRRRKAVEPQKPPVVSMFDAAYDDVDRTIEEAETLMQMNKPKPLNTYLPYLLEKADKAIKGDQAKTDQINAAKAVFAAEVMRVIESEVER